MGLEFWVVGLFYLLSKASNPFLFYVASVVPVQEARPDFGPEIPASYNSGRYLLQ